MTYLDTSALLKRFVAEPGTVVVNTLVSRQGPVATAKIAYAETHAAFARRHRVGNLSGPQYALTCRRFEHEWETWVRVDLDDDVLALARDMVRFEQLYRSRLAAYGRADYRIAIHSDDLSAAVEVILALPLFA